MDLGQKGEKLAASYLKKLGWRILACNIRRKFGEIDILTRDENNVLVFMEVKTLQIEGGNLEPEDNLTGVKLFKMRKIAEAFANANPRLIWAAGWRIDFIAISVLPDGGYKLRHYKNL